MSNFRRRLASASACSLLLTAGCADRGAFSATPSIAVSPERVPIGGAIDVTLQFHVAPDAPRLPAGGRVLLRLLFDDGELMKSDDHEPTRALDDWTPGSTVQYTRHVVLPDVPYVGDVYIAVGISSAGAGDRLRLAAPPAADLGDRTYKLATLLVTAPTPQPAP